VVFGLNSFFCSAEAAAQCRLQLSDGVAHY
jgi:hypothetical protein